MKEKKTISIEQFIRQQSLISRRELLKLLNAGKVKVNQKVIRDINFDCHPIMDKVMINNKIIKAEHRLIYIKYYKPKGVLSTMEDPKERLCVGDVIKDLNLPLFPVGRLDKDSSGLLILSNDGDFAHRLSHPSFECKKYYRVTLDKKLNKKDCERLITGIILEDGPVHFQECGIDDKTCFVTISQGRNRVIRRSFDLLGYHVKQLHRVSIGSISLNGMKSGDLLTFTSSELKSFSLTGSKVTIKKQNKRHKKSTKFKKE